MHWLSQYFLQTLFIQSIFFNEENNFVIVDGIIDGIIRDTNTVSVSLG